jgi:hypothetical protein
MLPSVQPSKAPSSQPSLVPRKLPTSQPSSQPNANLHPTAQPRRIPSSQPSLQPKNHPTKQPIKNPSNQPSLQPSSKPSSKNIIIAIAFDASSLPSKSLSAIAISSGISFVIICFGIFFYCLLKNSYLSRRILPTSIMKSHTKIKNILKINPDTNFNIENQLNENADSNQVNNSFEINVDEEYLSDFQDFFDQNFVVRSNLEENSSDMHVSSSSINISTFEFDQSKFLSPIHNNIILIFF